MKVFDDGILLHDKVQPVFATHGPRSHFFGYYDKSPLDSAERRLLCHSVVFDGRPVRATDKAEIGYWDLVDGSYTSLADTHAFNWQQGAMLQWLPRSNCSQIIFNERFEDHFAAVILNLYEGNRRVLPTTIYSLTPDGRYALTPRFERLYYCRPGYSYQGIEQSQWKVSLPVGDGLLRLDLYSGQIEVLIETAALAQNQVRTSMKSAIHYVEHIMANPVGSKFIFLHRWTTLEGLMETRLYACNLDGSELQMFPDTGTYSHANWLNNEQFIIWGRQPGPYAEVRRSAHRMKQFLDPLLCLWRRHSEGKVLGSIARRARRDALLRFSVTNQSPALVGQGMLMEDGHPSVCPSNPHLLLIDTYEDAKNYRHLLLFHFQTGLMTELGRFYSPPHFTRTGYRCDLHPRWGPGGQLVCIDTIQRDQRQMLVLDVGDVLSEV
jgi:hypothetical protein